MKTIHGNKNIPFLKGHLKKFSPYTVSQYRLDLEKNSNKSTDWQVKLDVYSVQLNWQTKIGPYYLI